MTKVITKLHKMTVMLKKVIKILPSYVLFLIPSLITGMLIWTIFVDGKLYYCSDKVPILDFIPPFVHGSQYGDYYIASSIAVWGIWFLLLGLIIVLPYIFANKFYKVKAS